MLRSAVARAPVMRMAVPFMVGIALARWWVSDLFLAWVMALVGAVLYTIVITIRTRFSQRWWRGAVITLAMLALGGLWQVVRDPFRGPYHFQADDAHDQRVLIELVDIGYIGARTGRFDARVIAVQQQGRLVHASGRVQVVLAYDEGTQLPGLWDGVWIDTRVRRIDRIPDPGGFDARAYASSRGIAMEAFAASHQWLVAKQGWHWTGWFVTAREQVRAWLADSDLPDRERALALALVLGVRDELDHDQKSAFVRSGTMHALAVSGMHVGLIFVVLGAMMAWWGNTRWARWTRGLVILLALWAFAGLTGAVPSVMRAVIMFSVFTIGTMVGRSSGSLNNLFSAAFIMMLLDPLILMQLSFQLSFLAVLGIIMFYSPIMRLWMAPNKLAHLAWSGAAVSMAAQLTTTPLSLLMFKAFPVWFLPANILVVGLVSLGVYGCALLILLYKLPWIGAALTWLVTRLLLFLGASTLWFAGLPHAYPGVRIDPLLCMILYAVIALGAGWVMLRSRVVGALFLVAGIIACTMWAASACKVEATTRFTVHDQRSELAMSMQVGREITLLASNELIQQPWMQRRIEALERATGAMVTQVNDPVLLAAKAWFVGHGSSIRSGIWLAPGLRIGSVQCTAPGVDPVTIKLDALVLHGACEYDMDELARHYDTRMIVLAPMIDGLERWRIRRWCSDRGIACHDVKREGAFILERDP